MNRVGWRRAGPLLREALSAALSAPVASILTIIMIAGMCCAVLLTSGRTVGAEQAVISSIDSAGTRSIIFRAEPAAGLTTGVLERIRHIEGIEWSAAFGPVIDVQNAGFPGGGTKVPLRLAWGHDWEPLGIQGMAPTDAAVAYGSPAAIEQLGLLDPVGQVRTTRGDVFGVGGVLAIPDHLQFLEPVLLAPQGAVEREAPASLLVVIAARPDLVAPVADATASVLAVDDPAKVSVETSEDLATLRGLVEGQLGTFGRSLTLGILALTAVLAAAILYGIVMLRRKDFGRRRALGASQGLIIALLMTQVGLLGCLGAGTGVAVAISVLAVSGDPLPGPTYTVSVAVLAVTVGVLSSIAPAIAAARREPIAELRVP